MKREMFKPYLQFLLRIIRSVETRDQLLICHDLIDRFLEVFKLSIPADQMNEAHMELMDAYQLKHESETII